MNLQRCPGRQRAAARSGETFSVATGRPAAWKRDEPDLSWYDFACSYAAAKWPYSSPNHRRGIAEALIDATEAMLGPGDPPFPRAEIRRALRSWTFSARMRNGARLPGDLIPAVRWLEHNTLPVAALARPGTGPVQVRVILDRISRRQDGAQAAANTSNRKRMVINNAMEYAAEIGVLPSNPLGSVKWTRPRKLATIDPRVVVNAGQARRLLTAVATQGDAGARLEAFFGCMYYAALRPEEATDLTRANLISLPEQGWGELLLTHAEPCSGTRWTDSAVSRERSPLKHRAAGETRTVPVHPELAALLRGHIERFGTGLGGRIFVGPLGGILTNRTYLEVFHAARAAAFSKQEAASLLARRPYDLRHAAVSTWLNATGDPAQVAEWAGHSVDVLLRTYAKCISGQDEQAKRRILEATGSARPADGPAGTEAPGKTDGSGEAAR